MAASPPASEAPSFCGRLLHAWRNCRLRVRSLLEGGRPRINRKAEEITSLLELRCARVAVAFAACMTCSEFNRVSDCGAVVLWPRCGQVRLLSGASNTSRKG